MEYQFHPVSRLPAVDLTQTLVSFLMTPEQHERFLDRCSRASKVTVKLNRVGLLCAVATICAPRVVGHALAIPSIVLSLPNNLLTIIVSSRDIFAMLVVEYEFWVFTIMNAAYWYVMGGTLGGIRWCACVPCWLSTQLIISVDANIRTLLKMLPSSMIWIPGAICICTVSFIPVIDIDSSHFHSLLPAGRMVITRINILSNICMNLCLFVVRRCWTKRSIFTQEFAETRAIPCAVIRAKLCMRQPSTSVQPNNPENAVMEKATFRDPSSWKGFFNVRVRPSDTVPEGIQLQQLEFVPRKIMAIDATRTFVLAMPSPSSPRLHPISTVLLYTIGLAGLALSVCGVCQFPKGDEDGHAVFMLAYIGLGATVLFMTPFVLSYQRTMFRILATSFDVMFLWVEALIGWLGFSYAIEWDARCVSALSLMLWVHFTLFVDALTPVVRARFRFRKAFLTPVVALLAAGGAGFMVDIASSSSSTLFIPDRQFVCVDGLKREHCLKTASFVLHRIVALMMATLRLLWVLPFGLDEELLFLRAVVRFPSPFEMFPFQRHRTAAVTQEE